MDPQKGDMSQFESESEKSEELESQMPELGEEDTNKLNEIKHFLLHEIEEGMTMSSTNLRVLTSTREMSFRMWDKCIRTIIATMHKTLRDIRRQGMEHEMKLMQFFKFE